MKECKQCSAHMDDNAKFCALCGSPDLEPMQPPTQDTAEPPADQSAPSSPNPTPESSQEGADAADAAVVTPSESVDAPQDALVSLQKEESAVSTPPVPPSPQTEITAGITANTGGSGGKSFMKYIIGGAAVLAVIVIAVVAIFSGSGGGGDRDSSFYAAMGNTYDTIAAEWDTAAKETGLAALSAALEKKGVSQELSMSIPIDYMDPIAFAFLCQSNAAMDQFFLSLDLDFMGQNYTVAQISLDDHFLALASPLLFSGAYGLDLDRLESDLADSALGQMLGLEVEDVSTFLSSLDLSMQFQTRDFSLSEETCLALEGALNDLQDAIILPEGKSVNVSVNGVQESCVEYSFDVPVNAVRDYLATGAEALLKDETIRAFMDEMFLLSPDSFYYYDSSSEYMDEMLNEFLDSLDYTMDQFDAISFSGYVKGDHVVRFELYISSEGETLPIFLELGAGGNLTDAITLTATSPDGEEEFFFSHSGSIVPNNGVVESNLSMTYYDGYYEELKTVISGHFYWDTKAKDDNFSMTLQIPDEDASFEASGVLTVNGDELQINLTRCAFSDWYDTYDFPFTYLAYPTDRIQTLSQEVTDLLAMSEGEFYTLYMEIEASIANLWSVFW